MIAACRKLNVDTEFVINEFDSRERARLVSAVGLHERFQYKMTFCEVMQQLPYACCKLGEPRSDPVRGRDLAAHVFDEAEPGDRDRFCAWQVMNTQDTRDKLFIHKDAAFEQLRKWSASDAMSLFVTHPTKPSCVTTKSIYKSQIAINDLWAKAEVVCGPGCLGGLEDLDADQLSGATSIMGSPASVLTAPGGTGKSWTVGKIVAALVDDHVSVVCLTPTHKAKLNLRDEVPDGVTVSTIHSYTSFLNNYADECPTELFVIIDETSMVDVPTMGGFAAALMRVARRWQICLVGDDAQLQPVGRGEFFRKVIKQCPRDVVRLTKCHRAKTQAMYDFQLAVRKGTLPSGDGEVVDVRTFHKDDEIMEAAASIVAAEGARTKYVAWTNADVDKVNLLVQKRETGAPVPGKPFNAGDEVVYVGGNLESLTNAMCGTFVGYRASVKKAKNGRFVRKLKAVVDWGDGEFPCCDGDSDSDDSGSDGDSDDDKETDDEGTVDLSDLKLAYCLTVHKAQGSGYERVCVLCLRMKGMLHLNCDRRWLYTAVSRAKDSLVVLCTPDAAALAAREAGPLGRSVLDFRG
jgi:hypothetical protein